MHPLPRPDDRKQRGRADASALFPVAPLSSAVPAGYSEWLKDLKSRIHRERLQVAVASNMALVMLYWDLGQLILGKQGQEGWGARVIDRLAQDLRDGFPDMRGFSPRNLKYMRTFAAAWADRDLVQRSVAQLPWRHIIALLEKLRASEERLWYAAQAREHGWSRDILAVQIQAQAHLRFGKAQNNFPATLPPEDSDLAIQVFKDPYLFDFLGTAAPRQEAELQRGLVEHLQKFLLELGQGFAFVGQQVHLELGGQDFYLDLLFYHLKLRRYVAIELKARPFQPGDHGQLGIYMYAVDKLLRHGDDQATLGLLLVRSRNQVVVEYVLAGSRQPITVSQWETELTRQLPRELQGSLPSIEELEAELGDQWLDPGDAGPP
jgi:predicted nuclease of restriction endonuclease-like (RecB) superfamily